MPSFKEVPKALRTLTVAAVVTGAGIASTSHRTEAPNPPHHSVAASAEHQGKLEGFFENKILEPIFVSGNEPQPKTEPKPQSTFLDVQNQKFDTQRSVINSPQHIRKQLIAKNRWARRSSQRSS